MTTAPTKQGGVVQASTETKYVLNWKNKTRSSKIAISNLTDPYRNARLSIEAGIFNEPAEDGQMALGMPFREAIVKNWAITEEAVIVIVRELLIKQHGVIHKDVINEQTLFVLTYLRKVDFFKRFANVRLKP